jgi:hypothetical protein
MKFQFSGVLQEFINKVLIGREEDVDFIMSNLTNESSLSATRYVDFALSLV